jgi:hypothetical protein
MVRARPHGKKPPGNGGERSPGLAHGGTSTLRLHAPRAPPPKPEQGTRRQAQAQADPRPVARSNRADDLPGLLPAPSRPRRIGEKLNRDPECFPPPIPNRKDEHGLRHTWSRSVLAAMLRNPKYTSYNVWGRNDKRPGRPQIRPRAEWVWQSPPTSRSSQESSST